MWFVMAAAVAAECDQVQFDFAGQPACVAVVARSSDEVVITNTCDGPVLLDARVVRPGATPLVAPGGEVRVAAWSAFTVGFDGQLHAVVATPRCAEPKLATK